MTIHSDRTQLNSHRVLQLVLNATSQSGVTALLEELGVKPCPRRLSVPASDPILGIVQATAELATVGTFSFFHAELRVAFSPLVLLETCRFLRSVAPGMPFLAIVASQSYETLTFASFSADGELRHLTFDPRAPLDSDLDAILDLRVAPDEIGVSLALRFPAVLDVRAVSARFFAEVRAQRAAISTAWTGIPEDYRRERDQLALLLLCRLIFIYFLQRQGHLNSDPSYIATQLRERERRQQASAGIYTEFLVPLFFGVFNTRPERRDAAARSLGPLPYLNGGLFERTVTERHFASLDLPDSITRSVFDRLLDRFRFTTRDAAESRAGISGMYIDPEMLGRVFEGLMDAEERSDTGTFYTPPAVVDALTTETLACHVAQHAKADDETIRRFIATGDAGGLQYHRRSAITRVLRETRVLDPACGSGAFLLGALSRIASARAGLGEDIATARRDVVSSCLHGVDLLDDAALICSLRLWLALADVGDAGPAPLPNLDRSIRQGDSLLDPLELVTPRAGTGSSSRALMDRRVRGALAVLQPLSDRYLDADPEDRMSLRDELRRAETRLAEAWTEALDARLERELAVARADSGARDLWGDVTAEARTAERAISQVSRRRIEVASLARRIAESSSVPFFSFRVHFARQKLFDIVLSNPPWVRAHRWPAVVGAAVRERYEVCRNAGWPAAVRYGSRAGGQVDLAVLFLERAIGLLADGGTLGMLLPAKLLRSLYAGGARGLLHRDLHVVSVDDYSLDQRAIFKADAFTVSLVGRRVVACASEPSPPADVRVRMHRRDVAPVEFLVKRDELALIPGDSASPWLLAPPSVLAGFRRMQTGGATIAQQPGVSLGRGVVTGANDVLVVREFTHKLGGLTHIRAEGYFRTRKLARSVSQSRKYVAYIETHALRPLVRGSDVHAWHCEPSARIVWTRMDGRGRHALHPRLDRYLTRHSTILHARTGIRSGAPLGTVMRVSPATLGHKVVWSDIARTLNAAALPDLIRGDAGRPVPVIPLNTTYFLAVPDRRTALLLTAYMNALPLRLFARACAERAKDAHFRFFAWTVGVLPLPASWLNHRADELCLIAEEAHACDGITPVQQARLDAVVASNFGLCDDEFVAMLEFDRWLSGVA